MKYHIGPKSYCVQIVDGVLGLSIWKHDLHEHIPMSDKLAEEVKFALRAAYNAGRKDKIQEIRKATMSIISDSCDSDSDPEPFL